MVGLWQLELKIRLADISAELPAGGIGGSKSPGGGVRVRIE